MIACPSPEFGSVRRSANCASSHPCSWFHHRSAAILMEPEPLIRRQAAFTPFGIMAMHLT
jgi:hypothetical protein